MKKFFNLFLTAMVMCAAVSMTSCSKDDDDPVVNEEVAAPQFDEVKYYKASLTADMFTYYDIKLELSNGKKKMEVTLTPSNCEKKNVVLTDIYEYQVMEIDGVLGVENVKATVTPKANANHMFAETKAPEIYLSGVGRILTAYYFPASNKLIANTEIHCEIYVWEPKGFLNTDSKGIYQYETYAEMLSEALSGR